MRAAPRLARVKRERFMPFRYEPFALRMRLVDVRTDDEPPFVPEAADIDSGSLYLEDDRWERLRLRLTLDLDAGALERLIPEAEQSAPPIRFLLRIEAPDTRIRRSLVIDLESGPPFELEVSLAHHEIAGPVTISPWLVRSASAAVATGFAREAGQRLAAGRALLVHPYAPHAKSGQFLDVQYRSFAEDPRLRRETHRIHFLDVGSEPPVLFINSDHREVAEVLDARGQVGMKARLREVFYDVVSFGVWTQLFMHACEALSDDGECRHGWQEGVLAELLPAMFPNARNHSARVHELLAVRESDHPLSQLSELCDRALQERLDLARHMQRLVQAGLATDKAGV